MLLKGIKVVELAGLAPAPFCGRILSDYGAQVVRIDRLNAMQINLLDANKRSLILNLKKPSAVSVVKRMCQSYDVLIDPYRPGVLEKIGLGPSDVMKQNPQLIYARLSGFGQSGPLAKAAGHDINYMALSGILSMLGRKETKPTPPVNLVADFAGGGLLCAFGIVVALFSRVNSGSGQVVDMSMSEGAAYVGSWLYSAKNTFLWGKARGENWIDSGAHFYDTYETRDGRYMAVGAIEPKFFHQVLKGLELKPEEVDQLSDFDENKKIMEAKFMEKTQEEWCKIFASLDACVTPVLSLDEAPNHPHNIARENFRKVKGQQEPNPAPRLTDVNGTLHEVLKERQRDEPPCPTPGEHSLEILKELGYSQRDIEELSEENCVILGKVNSKL